MTIEELNEAFGGRFGFVAVGECWEWRGPGAAPAKRVWERVRGPIPYKPGTGLSSTRNSIQVCHTCDNRKCGRLEHLWLGTQKDNMIDGARKGRVGLRGIGLRPMKKELVAEMTALVKFPPPRTVKSVIEFDRTIARQFNVSAQAVGDLRRRSGFTWPRGLKMQTVKARLQIGDSVRRDRLSV